jgi:glycosyltransferase involved in cell wall biosynthesis
LIHNLFGVVAIGRNEGSRLRGCLESVIGSASLVVYVDSGSSDSSVDLARGMGCDVVELDMTIPFTAARARNAGFQRLSSLQPDLEFVFFVDGDCEVNATWPDIAINHLRANQNVAAVNGRNREKFPERSIYNLLCDFVWDRPVGPVKYFGGNVMIRASVMQQVNGFREDLIAGEEPELCVRIRAAGWSLECLAAEMTLHDANILRFSQWWRRTKRGGYAYTEGAFLHGRKPERHFVRQTMQIAIWGGIIPLISIFAFLHNPWAALFVIIYPVQILRITLKGNRNIRDNFMAAFFLVFGRFAEFTGLISFILNKLQSRGSKLIEYK